MLKVVCRNHVRDSIPLVDGYVAPGISPVHTRIVVVVCIYGKNNKDPNQNDARYSNGSQSLTLSSYR